MLSVVHVFLGMAGGLLRKKKIRRQYPATREDNTSDRSRRVTDISRAQLLFFFCLFCFFLNPSLCFPYPCIWHEPPCVKEQGGDNTADFKQRKKNMQNAVIFIDVSILVSSFAGWKAVKS